MWTLEHLGVPFMMWSLITNSHLKLLSAVDAPLRLMLRYRR